MFEDVVVAAQFRAFHGGVSDALLDEAARAAGCGSGIGRLCLVSDEMLAGICARLDLRHGPRVLDIGCGRGFLERWLQHRGYGPRAFGLDRAAEAIDAARRQCPGAQFVQGDYRTHPFQPEFEAAFALDIAASGKFGASLLAAIRSALREGGRFAITAPSLDGRHEGRLHQARTAMLEHFSDIEILDATREAASFAKRLYASYLRITAWRPEIRSRFAEQAGAVLRSIDRGDFHYAIAFGATRSEAQTAHRAV